MTYSEYLERCVTEYLAPLLSKHNGRVRAVAQEAGVSRATMYRMLRSHGLIKPVVRGNDQWRALR